MQLSLRDSTGTRHIQLDANGLLGAPGAPVRDAWTDLVDALRTLHDRVRQEIADATTEVDRLAARQAELQVRSLWQTATERLQPGAAPVAGPVPNPSQQEIRRLEQQVADLGRRVRARERALDQAGTGLNLDPAPLHMFTTAHDAAGSGIRPRAATTLISTTPALAGIRRRHPFLAR
ncbi:hypothetical protein, partial [Nocardia alni]|uniref:hypothetical protein n=1 Tax=Nocardia alni TaxID=2815723 RepID=UPI001C20F6EF